MTRILVVEDDELNLKLVKILLQREGYEVKTSMNAEEALKEVLSNDFDLILMDIQLPKMDGLTLTKIIKENPMKKNIPIVALTAFAMRGDRERAINAGCDGYIEKPIDTQKFILEVKKFLGGKNENIDR